MELACKCLNVRLSLRGPSPASTPAPNGAATDDSFLANASRIAEGSCDVAVSLPRLLSARDIVANDGSEVRVVRCRGCKTDTHATDASAPSSVAMVNGPHLLAGRGAINLSMGDASFSKVFQIVIPSVGNSNSSSGSSVSQSDDNGGGGGGGGDVDGGTSAVAEPHEDVAAILQNRYQEYIQAEERKMRAKIEAFKEKQMEQFKSLQAKGTDDQLKMFRLMASIGDHSTCTSPSPRVKTPQLLLFSSDAASAAAAAQPLHGDEGEEDGGTDADDAMFAFDDADSGKVGGGRNGGRGHGGGCENDSDSDYDDDGGRGRDRSRGGAPLSPTAAAGMLGTSLTRSSLPISIPLSSSRSSLPRGSIPHGSMPRSSVPRGSIPVGSFQASSSFADSNQHMGSAREFAIRSRQELLSTERRRSGSLSEGIDRGEIQPGSPPK